MLCKRKQQGEGLTADKLANSAKQGVGQLSWIPESADILIPGLHRLLQGGHLHAQLLDVLLPELLLNPLAMLPALL